MTPARFPQGAAGVAVLLVALGAPAAPALAAPDTHPLPLKAEQDDAGLTWNLQTLRRVQANPGALPLDLARAWQLAYSHDPTWLAAVSEQAASQTERAQGRAALLPQIQAGYSRNRISGTTTQRNWLGQQVTSDLKYDSTSLHVQLQQPVLNYARYADYQRGAARAALGDDILHQRQQEAGLRISEAYFHALLTRTATALNTALVESLRQQATALEALHRLNEANRIDAQTVTARLELAQADLIAAHDEERTALRELQGLIGQSPGVLTGLAPDFPITPLYPVDLDGWLALARTNNPEVRVARQTLNVARAEVQRAVSRYLPSMDLVAGYAKADSENLSSLSQRTNTFSVGLHVNIPLFSGGYDTAYHAQTRARQRQSQQELDAAAGTAETEVARQYALVTGGEKRAQALAETAKSSRFSVAAAQTLYERGQGSLLDILRAQDRLQQTLHDLARVRVDYLLARVRLAAAAGALTTATIDEINHRYLSSAAAPASTGLLRVDLAVGKEWPLDHGIGQGGHQ